MRGAPARCLLWRIELFFGGIPTPAKRASQDFLQALLSVHSGRIPWSAVQRGAFFAIESH